MADPNTPIDLTAQLAQQKELTKEQLEQGIAIAKAQQNTDALAASQINLNDQSQNYSSILNNLTNKLKDVGIGLSNVGELTGAKATQFGLISAAIVNTTEKFQNLQSNLDASRLGSFKEQAKTLIDTLKTAGPGTQIAIDAAKKLASGLTAMGGGGKDLQEAIKAGENALINYANNIIKGADNTLRFQSILLQGAAQAGNITNLYNGISGSFKGVGQNLENLNEVSKQLISIQAQSATAVGISSDQMAKYTAILLQTPGGLEAMTKGIDFASKNTGALTAVYQIAQASGLDFAQTFQDVSHSVLESGMSYQDATKFASRFADISKDLNAPISDVRKALIDASSGFKLWNSGGEQAAKMNQGLADSVKNYARALEAAQVPAQAALEIAQSQTKQMGSLTEAQESFISLQTGGSGGIRGSLEFEELLKNDPVAAQKKIADSMKQAMGGKILTRKEALDTGQEDQYMKQRLMLTQGTLGMRANSNAEADQMINALSSGTQFKKTTDLEAIKSQQEITEKATDQQRLTFTGMKQANLAAETVMLQAGVINTGFLENAFSAGSGSNPNAGEGINVKGREILRNTQDNAANFDNKQLPLDSAFKSMGNVINTSGTLIKSGMNSALEQTGFRTTPQISKGDQIKNKVDTKKAVNYQINNPDQYLESRNAGKQVGAVLAKNKPTENVEHSNKSPLTNQAHMGGPIPVSIPGGLHVHIAACPHCKTPYTVNANTSAQSAATSVAASK